MKNLKNLKKLEKFHLNLWENNCPFKKTLRILTENMLYVPNITDFSLILNENIKINDGGFAELGHLLQRYNGKMKAININCTNTQELS